ncbi:MAG: PTS sugar transporter subunit IIA [Clostridiaceae bacterium]
MEIIMVSHGYYAKTMLESAQLIAGEQDHICVFGLHLGDSVDQLREEVSKAIEEAQKNGEVLVLTDMFSGSPFNAVVSLMQHYSFHHLTGINLPILLEILMSRDSSSAEEICRDVLKKAKDTVIDVNKYFEEMS